MEQHKVIVQRTRRSSQQIRALLTSFDEGGFTVKEFCLLHGMSTGTFHKWQSRYRDRPDQQDPSPGFSELLIRLPEPGSLFAEVNGIRLYQPVQASFLKALLP